MSPTGSSYADVMGARTQLKARTRLNSLEEVVATNDESGGEIFELHDVLASDQEDPGTKAASKMDWESFMAELSARDQAIIQFMIEGKSRSEMARKLNVCTSTIQTSKKNLALKIQDYMGYKILIDVQRSPRWKQDLETIREKLACKHERSSHLSPNPAPPPTLSLSSTPAPVASFTGRLQGYRCSENGSVEG